VNGYADIDGEQRYAGLMKEVERADRTAGLRDKDRFAAELKVLDKEMEEQGKLHYTVKYNRFMGVKSDWKDDSLSS
jgi:hypothetical protein